MPTEDALRRSVARWITTERDEAGGDEQGAETLFRAIFEALPAPGPRRGFSRRVLQAARLAALPAGRYPLRRPWWHTAVAGGAAAALAAVLYLAGGAIARILLDQFVTAVALIPRACLWFIQGFSAGLDVWTLLARAGAAIAAAVARPQVTLLLLIIEGTGALALYVLLRLIGQERQWSRQ